MFAVIVATRTRRFKGDWRRAGGCDAKKRNCDNRERFARHSARVISFCHCCVESKTGRILRVEKGTGIKKRVKKIEGLPRSAGAQRQRVERATAAKRATVALARVKRP